MKKFRYILLSMFSLAVLFSCSDREDIRNDIDDLNARLDKLEAMLPQMNEDIAHYQGLLNGQLLVFDYKLEENGDYTLELSDGTVMTVYSGKPNSEIPVMSIGSDGYWYYTMDGETLPLLNNGEKVSANPENGKTPQFRVNAEGMWEYSYDGFVTVETGIGLADPNVGEATFSIFRDVKVSDDGQSITFTWKNGDETLTKTINLYGGLDMIVDTGDDIPVFKLGEKKEFNITQEGVEKIVIETLDWGIQIEDTKMYVTAPSTNVQGKEYQCNLMIKIFSKEGYCRLITVSVKLSTTNVNENTAQAWQYFSSKSEYNVLLDYSYAGYMHGEVAPPDVNMLSGYTTVNVQEYKKKNGIDNDRLALNSILYDYKLVRKCPGKADNKNINENAKLVIYFPEGEYLLQDGTEDTAFPEIYGGNFVIKGAGADLTRIKMTGLNDKLNAPLLNIKHTNSPINVTHSPLLATVSDNAEKGDFTVKVTTTVGITTGKWVQLRLRSGNKNLIASELGGITPGANWAINTQPSVQASGNEDTNGVRILEFHQIKSVGNGTVTFEEPIMHDIDVAYNDCGGWQIREYKYFENVGVEDLSSYCCRLAWTKCNFL